MYIYTHIQTTRKTTADIVPRALKGVAVNRTHLRLNADFDDTAGDGEDITDDKEDIPAINELQPVCPAHFTMQCFFKKLHKLLENTKRHSKRN